MESLLPSEIARLVFGYLEEQGCQKASQALLEELPDLAECAKLRRKGKRVKKKVGDQTLVDMLQDYSAARDEIQEAIDKYQKFSSVNKHDTLYQQIKSLLDFRISGWQKSVQPHGVLCTSSEAQRARTMKLLKFHKAKHMIRDSSMKQPPSLVLDVNATQIGDLPGCSQNTSNLSYHVEDEHPVMPYMSEASNPEMSHLSVDTEHMADMVDSGGLSRCAKDDKVIGDRGILPGQEMSHMSHVTPQKRKGQVRRRSQSSPKSGSPFAEEDFEKILKSLYENTALHEKIAENINRGLNYTKQSSGVENAETPLPHAEPQTQPLGREKEGSSDTFVQEFDQMVNNIISETTADPIFENLVGDVFVSAAPMSSAQVSSTSTRQPKPDMLHQFVCNLSSSSQGDKADEACRKTAGGEDTRSKSVMMVPVAGQNSEVRVEIMDGHLHKNGLTSPLGKPLHNRAETFVTRLNCNEGSGPSSSRPRRTCAAKMYAVKKKAARKKRQTSAEKEAERKLGEDLIREFEEFQSKRPDRVSESETNLLSDQSGLCSFIDHVDMPSLDISDPNEEVESKTKNDSSHEADKTPKRDKQDYQGDKDGALACSGSEVSAPVGMAEENKTTQPVEQGLSQCRNQITTDVPSSTSSEQLLQSMEPQNVQVDQSECEIGLMGNAAEGHEDTVALSGAKMSANDKETGKADIGSMVPSSTQHDCSNFVNGSNLLNKVDFNVDIGSQPVTANLNEVIQGEGRDSLNLSSPTQIQSVTVKTTTVPGISVAGSTDVSPDNLNGGASPYTLTELAPMNIQQQEAYEQFQQAQTVQTFHSYQPASYSVNTDGPEWTAYVQQGGIGSGSDNVEHHSNGGTDDTHFSASKFQSQGNTTVSEETQKWDTSTNVQDQQSTDDTPTSTNIRSLYLTSVDETGVLKQGQVVKIPLAEDAVPKVTVLQIIPPQYASKMSRYVPIQPKAVPNEQHASSCTGTSNSSELSVESQGVFVLPNDVKVSIPCVGKEAAEVPKVKKKKKERKTNKETDTMNNDIISRALSFALSSVTPKKASPKKSGDTAKEGTETEAGGLPVQEEAAMDMTSAAVNPKVCEGSTPPGHQLGKEVMKKQLNETSECQEEDKNEKGEESKRKEICSSDMQVSPVLKKLLALSKALSPDKLKDSIPNYQSAMKASSPVQVQVSARKCRSTPSRKSSQARAVRALDFSTPCKSKSPSRSPSKAAVSLRFSPKSHRNIRSPSKVSPQNKQDLVLKKTPSKTITRNEIVQHETQPVTFKDKTPQKQAPRKKTPTKVSPKLSEHKTPTKRTPPKRAVKNLSPRKEAKQVQKGSSRLCNVSSSVHKGRSVSVVKARTSPARKRLINIRNTSLAMIPEEGECQTRGTLSSAVKEKNYCEDDEESLVLQMEEDSEVASQNCSSEHLEMSMCEAESNEMSMCEAESNEDNGSFKKLEKSLEMEATQATPMKIFDSSKSIDLLKPAFDTPLVYCPSDPCGPENNDLNTPVIPNVQQDLETKTPRLKDYPQGPYSNSSVSTSYYHPSEHSVTDSDGMTSPRLVMDDHILDSSPVALAVQQLSDVSSDASPNKRISPIKKNASSSRIIGKVIEQELQKLFKSDCQQPLQKETKNQEGSQGKLAKKRRAPSANYRNISESTCSEDEVESTLLGSAKVRSKLKASQSEVNDSRSRTRLRKRHMSMDENDNHTSKEEGKATKDVGGQVNPKYLDKATEQDLEEGRESVPSHCEQNVDEGTSCVTISPKTSVGDGKEVKSYKNLPSKMGSGRKRRYFSPKSPHTKKNFENVFGSDISSSDGEEGLTPKKVLNDESEMLKSCVEDKDKNVVPNDEGEIEDAEGKPSKHLCSEDRYSSPKEDDKANTVPEGEKLEEKSSQSTVGDGADVVTETRRSGRKSVRTKFLNIQHGVTTRSKLKDSSSLVLKEVSIEVVASSRNSINDNENYSETHQGELSSKFKSSQSTSETLGGAGIRKVVATRSSTRQRDSLVKDKQKGMPAKNIGEGQEKSHEKSSSESSTAPAADSKHKVKPSPFTLWGSDVRAPDKPYFSSDSVESSAENCSDKWLKCWGSKKSKCEKELSKGKLRKLIPEGNEWWWKKIENDESLVMPAHDDSLVIPLGDKKKKKKKKRKKDRSKKKKGCARLIDYRTSPLFKGGTPSHHIRDDEYGEMVNITPRLRRRRRYADEGQKTPSATESPAKVCPRFRLSPAKSPYKGYYATTPKSLFSPKKSIQRSIHFLNRKEQEHELESRQSPSGNCVTPVSETEEVTNDPEAADKNSGSHLDKMNKSNHHDDNDEVRKIIYDEPDEVQGCEESNATSKNLNENSEALDSNHEASELSLPCTSVRKEGTKTGSDETGNTEVLKSVIGSESSDGSLHSRLEVPSSFHSLWSEYSFSAENISLPNSVDKQNQIQEKDNEIIPDKEPVAVASKNLGRCKVASDVAALLPSEADLAKKEGKEGVNMEACSPMVLTHKVQKGNYEISELERSLNDEPDVFKIMGTSNEPDASVNHKSVSTGSRSDMGTDLENSLAANAEDTRENLQKDIITLHGIDVEGNTAETTAISSNIDEDCWRIEKQLAEMHGFISHNEGRGITESFTEGTVAGSGNKENGGTSDKENKMADCVTKESVVTSCVEKESFVTDKDVVQYGTLDCGLLGKESEERTTKAINNSDNHSDMKTKGNYTKINRVGGGNNKEVKTATELDGNSGVPPEQCQNLVSSAQESSGLGHQGQDMPQNAGNKKYGEAGLRREWNEEGKGHDEMETKNSVMSANGRQGEKEKSSSGSEISMEECPSPSDTDNLLTFTPLPNTPSKEVARICRDIVKEKCAMVAFPSESPTKKNVGTKSPVKERLITSGKREQASIEPSDLASRLVEVCQEPKDAESGKVRRAHQEVQSDEKSDESQASPTQPKVKQIIDLNTSVDKTDWVVKGQKEEEVRELKDSNPDLSGMCVETGETSESLEVVEEKQRACADDRSHGQNSSNQKSPLNQDITHPYDALISIATDGTIEVIDDEYEVREEYLYVSQFIDILTMNIETPIKELHAKKEKKHSKRKSEDKKSPKQTHKKITQSTHAQNIPDEPGHWEQRKDDGSKSSNHFLRSRSKSMTEMNEKSSVKESGSSCVKTRNHDERRKRTHSSPPTPGVIYSEQDQSWKELSHFEKDALNDKDLSKEQAVGFRDKELKESGSDDSTRRGPKNGQSPSQHELQPDSIPKEKLTLDEEVAHRTLNDDMEKVEPSSSGKMETWLKHKKYAMKDFAKGKKKSQDSVADHEADPAQGEMRDRLDSASPVSLESLPSCSQDKQKLFPPSVPQEVCYLLESESSIEATETEDKSSRQRHPRELSQILKSGSSLEIAKSPQKQLAIINTHEQYDTYFYVVGDETSHSSFPPTPGKFFVTTPTCPYTTQTTVQLPSAKNAAQNSTKPQGSTFLSSASSSSSESSKSLPAPHRLPPKKRKFIETEPHPSKDAPVSKRLALKTLRKMKDLDSFLSKVHRP